MKQNYPVCSSVLRRIDSFKELLNKLPVDPQKKKYLQATTNYSASYILAFVKILKKHRKQAESFELLKIGYREFPKNLTLIVHLAEAYCYQGFCKEAQKLLVSHPDSDFYPLAQNVFLLIYLSQQDEFRFKKTLDILKNNDNFSKKSYLILKFYQKYGFRFIVEKYLSSVSKDSFSKHPLDQSRYYLNYLSDSERRKMKTITYRSLLDKNPLPILEETELTLSNNIAKLKHLLGALHH